MGFTENARLNLAKARRDPKESQSGLASAEATMALLEAVEDLNMKIDRLTQEVQRLQK